MLELKLDGEETKEETPAEEGKEEGDSTESSD